jgi:hypothetical protein
MNNDQQVEDVPGFGGKAGGVVLSIGGPQPMVALRDAGKEIYQQPVTPLSSKLGSGTEG